MQSKSQQALLEKKNKDKFTLKCTQRGKESQKESQKFGRLTYPDFNTL